MCGGMGVFMGLGRRVAEYDDRSALTLDGTNRRNKRSIVAGWILSFVLVVAVSVGLAAARGSAKGWVSLAVLVGAIAFVSGYVVWRRKRNERLTGSPTSWPNR